jgi:cysteine-rich repeat protein
MGWSSGLARRAGVVIAVAAGTGLGCGQSHRSDESQTDAGSTGGAGASGTGTGGTGTGGTGVGGTGAVPTGGTDGTIQVPCGNGELDDDEECDDGNRTNGDGCSYLCWVENPTCGDGVRVRAEACDDGNTASGDGCQADCRLLEDGYLCVPGNPCTLYHQCGDSRVDPNELCDDGNLTSGDGCSRCDLEVGWACEGMPSFCHRTTCGDANIEGHESCDDGGTEPGDGCSADCHLEADCTANGICTPLCGDGALSTGEQCDDANLRSGDGCSENCMIEDGFSCEDVAVQSICLSICGDRLITLREECDDGFNTNDYGPHGCGTGCVRAPFCGDGIIDSNFGEMCDDGNDRLGPEGGCSGCVLPP